MASSPNSLRVNFSEHIHPRLSFSLRAFSAAALFLFAQTATSAPSSQTIENQTIQQIGAELRSASDTDKLPPTSPPQPPLSPPRKLTLEQAVALTLEKNQNILLSRESVTVARGTLRQAAGPFDPTLSASSTASYQKQNLSYSQPEWFYSEFLGIDKQVTSQSSSSETQLSSRLQLAKTFRNGVTLAPVILYDFDGESETGYGENDFQGMLGFTLQIPLLRGLGPNSINTANERAARINLEANEFLLEFQISQQVFNSIQNYWNCLLAQETVRIARSNESSAFRLLEITEALIKGYVQPKTSLVQARANYEQYRSQRILAEQQQSQASQTLAVSLGLSPEELLREPLVIDRFPPLSRRQAIRTEEIPDFVKMSLTLRPDLTAARKNEAANFALLQGAKNNALPQLDTSLGAALQSTGDRTTQSSQNSSSSGTGYGVAASASLAWPLRNDAAEGAVLSQKGYLQQAKTQVSLQESQVASAVVTAAKSVINSSGALAAAESSTRDQRASVEAQEKLFSMGMSSLVEVITTQTDLASAELNLVQTQCSYATALAQLRFATGTLLAGNSKTGYSIPTASLLLPPQKILPKTPPPQTKNNAEPQKKPKPASDAKR